MTVVFVLAIIFWTAEAPAPVKMEILSYATDEECVEAGHTFDALWSKSSNGASTSWQCLGAVKVPST